MNLLHYGLQRSGTNYFESLLKANYQVRFLNSNKDRSSPLQKHCRFYKNKEIIPEPQYRNEIVLDNFEQFESLFKVVPEYYLIVSKDPYSWYLSYRNWAKKCKWPAVSHNYIEEYSLFYKCFVDFACQSNKFIFIKYIDLISRPNETLEALESKMNLKKSLISRLKLKNPAKVSQSGSFSDSRRDYYLGELYLQEYGQEEIQELNKLIDPEVMSFLGYEFRSASR